MAIFINYTPEQQALWDEWVATRPPVIQETCKKVQPNKLYRLKSNNNRCFITTVHEDETVTVAFTAEFNPEYSMIPYFERQVFGIALDDLEECDLPEGWMPDEE